MPSRAITLFNTGYIIILLVSFDTTFNLVSSVRPLLSTTDMHLTTILSALVAASGILAAPTSLEIDARAVVNHDSLNPIRTRLQPGAIGRAIERF